MAPLVRETSLTGEKMKRQVLQGLLFLPIFLNAAYGEEIPDVSLRFYAQWDVGEKARQRLDNTFGPQRVSFDAKGKVTPHNLPSNQIKRWRRLYELCMSDGCYYCDANEGSCETGTCGPKNAQCKPYLNSQGLPKCGSQCADYAFTATLP
jgi:hypothetical protein